LRSASTSILNSWISDIKSTDQDSQAIAGWNGPGPFSIRNNYLEAAGENFLLGGADPAISGLVPTGITFRDNWVRKLPAWRGGGWQVKNLLELKSARGVVIENNLFENNWEAAQAGFVQAAGKLEHREGTTNVVVNRIDRLNTDELPERRPRHIAPPIPRETGLPAAVPIALSKRSFDGVREAAMAELAASLPAPHSFGRRGR
jgi:hypothetical protein